MNEHMPVGGLVAPINCNDSQALSDGNIDDLRSDCHDAAVRLDGKRQANRMFSRYVEYALKNYTPLYMGYIHEDPLYMVSRV